MRSDHLNVLIVSPISDVAGGGIGLKHAFDAAGGEWKARHVRGGSEWLDYPADAEWEQIEELWDWADVVHVMELPKAVMHLPRKPTVVYHTGSRYRRDPERRSHEAQKLKALEVSASLDLCRLRRTPWLPIVADLDRIAAMSESNRHSDTLRVAHAPTNRELKSTDLILDVLSRLPVEVDLIERVPWEECLRRKAQSDLYVDELTLGYGMNAVECWAMDVPVVSGIADERFRRDALKHWGRLPFVDADADSLEDVLRALIASHDLRAQAALDGRAFAYRYHSQAAVVERCIGFYTRARAVFNRRTAIDRTHRRITVSYEPNT